MGIIGDDRLQRAQPLPVEHLAVRVDQEEAAVLVHAVPAELDGVTVEDPQPLDGRDPHGGDVRVHDPLTVIA